MSAGPCFDLIKGTSAYVGAEYPRRIDTVNKAFFFKYARPRQGRNNTAFPHLPQKERTAN